MVITRNGASQNLDKVTSFVLFGKKITFYEGQVVSHESNKIPNGEEHSYEHIPGMTFFYSTQEEARAAFDKINQLLNAIEV